MKITKQSTVYLDHKIYLLEEGDEVNIIPGGLADGMSPEDIAKMHGISIETINKQIDKGTKAELEHTSDEKMAREISIDHLYEDPNYYDKLEKMEENEVEESEMIDGSLLMEASVHRRYLKVTCKDEDRYFSPSSANDNYFLYFIDRLFNSKKFNNGSYKIKLVRKIPVGHKKKSLETFLKELMPIPEKKKGR